MDPRFRDALDGLQDFSHVWLLCWLGRDVDDAGDPALKRVPFLLRDRPRVIGILATRGPRRLNPIGLSLVRLLAGEGATVPFAGVDMLDGTPVLDIKPYIARLGPP
jgi:tRNA (adenine37-N6)-methyltransferase